MKLFHYMLSALFIIVITHLHVMEELLGVRYPGRCRYGLGKFKVWGHCACEQVVTLGHIAVGSVVSVLSTACSLEHSSSVELLASPFFSCVLVQKCLNLNTKKAWVACLLVCLFCLFSEFVFVAVVCLVVIELDWFCWVGLLVQHSTENTVTCCQELDEILT